MKGPKEERRILCVCVCVEGGGKKHGTVTNSTFELEIVSGSLKAMLLPYYEFGCVTNSQRACHGVVLGLFLLMDQLSGSRNWANNCFFLGLQVPM